MRGAIAAGHPVTAEVGATVLAEGGNAIDAAIAAGFASWVAESPLSGPGGGGFMLVHDARDGSTRVLDFFVTVPQGGVDPQAMQAVDVPFDSATTQIFLIGPASVAVPGIALGLEEAHRRYGTLPWRDLIAPAVDHARLGVEVTPTQAYLHDILSAIVGPATVGERLRFGDFALTLERIAEEGPRFLYTGDAARALCETAPQITMQDLAAYEVIERDPVMTRFRGNVFAANPPPSSGGVLIAYGLKLLERLGFDASALVETMRAQDEARDERFLVELYSGGLARRLVDAPTMTTHVSVVDEDGSAASLSCSLGSGSGVVVPGTGIALNNMLGERDLAGVQRVGERLTSMMAPSVCFDDDGGTRLVVGSAGSARLRGAIMQVVVNVLGRGLDVKSAVERPRLHLDGAVVHAEGGADVDGIEELDRVQWKGQNLYFGGANAVEVLPGGAAFVVE